MVVVDMVTVGSQNYWRVYRQDWNITASSYNHRADGITISWLDARGSKSFGAGHDVCRVCTYFAATDWSRRMQCSALVWSN